ncbi:molybdopterin-dependent oxidoreductase [Conexibacter sp. DBS9H8]|uniref:molybdopterin-dependent oxidoreductase n=1 Tax=Conexibacter sp. DBS9H8 TaxID=2937801 RepID=UPI00200E10C7|nr:molybdopterin-dependent oxidoreductase [Conexibacter sp. DBS9H8]
MSDGSTRVSYRSCALCEASCGLELTLDGDRVLKVRGDAADVFSHGFICPKGASIGSLHHDPDRLRMPLRRGPDGSLAECGWEEAFAAVADGLGRVQAAHGRDAVAMYTGNPGAHALALALYGRVLAKALGTRNLYTASTVDQFPKMYASALMFGAPLSVAVPDLDRTDFLLLIGANPWASNGSLMTAPDTRGRLRALRRRGGRLIVIDPRRTQTATAADRHHFIRPGTDALALFALVQVILAEGRSDLGRLAPMVNGLEALDELAAPFTPEAVAPHTGIPAADLRALARELADAPSAAVYGRFGTSTQSFGTVASWLIDVLNILTGNLDTPGGAMFPWPAVGHAGSKGPAGSGRGARPPRFHSRVRGQAEILGELPAACLAEEIDTPGEGRVRALITLAGNPVLSLPNGDRLDAALGDLEFMVSVDFYLNETTRHADVILPVPSPLEKAHYELIIAGFSIRDVAHYSPATLPRPDGMPEEDETLLRLSAIAAGLGADADPGAVDAAIALGLTERESATSGSPAHGLDPEAILAALAPRTGAERMLDLMLRTGPYGLGFPELDAPGPGETCLAHLEAHPHGVDYGPLRPHLPEILRTPSGRIELAPAPILADLPRLRARLTGPAPGPDGELLMIGRRDLRSNNSWMHNLDKLVDGPLRCRLQIHPADAARAGIADGDPVTVRSRVGAITAPAQVTDAIMPGVLSLPHGWGHGRDDTRQRVANAHPGVNLNVLSDDLELEPLTGTAVLCGVPVRVTRAAVTPA